MRVLTDPVDGYSPVEGYPGLAIQEPAPVQDSKGALGFRGWLATALKGVVKADGYQNTLTGVGDPTRDKTFGGRFNGPDFVNQLLTGWECQERWRGSDLGGRMVETIPREMVRKGWSVKIQPEPDEPASDSRTDDFPAAPPKAPQHKPEELSRASDDNTAIIEALSKEQERVHLASALELGLSYERNYGGAGILLGVDDGETDLTRPLDWSKVRRINHLTAFRGGWDGELIAWRYYVDPRLPDFGKPEIYQLRNIGVPISSPPAPGEGPGVAQAQTMPRGPGGTLVFYVHESRFILFDGDPKSRWAQVQMRGWGDSIWTRVNEVLSQYCQSWQGVAVLMQELGAPILKMEGFAQFLTAQDGSGLATIQARAIAMQMAMSIAKTRILDAKESMERLPTQLAGVAEILREFALRLAAAAGMPFSMLMGQVQGGLGDASKGDISFFDDQIVGLQAKKLVPALRQFIGLQFACSEGVTRGRTPSRWSVTSNPQREMTPSARADYVYKIAQADTANINAGVVTPEEVAATRFGGSEFNDGPIVLDFETRAATAAAPPEPEPTDPSPAADPGLASQEPESSLTAQHDAADFVTRNGRTKVRTAASVVVPFGPDGRALMGVRADSGRLAFPGGHAEPGEDALSTAVRELHEETGLHPRRIVPMGTKAVGGPLAHVLVSVFRAIVDGEPTNAGDPDREFSAFEWVDLSGGDYPDDVKARLHHERDVVGPMLRRR